MTDQSRLQLTDALIEKMLAQRAGPGAPADLVPSDHRGDRVDRPARSRGAGHPAGARWLADTPWPWTDLAARGRRPAARRRCGGGGLRPGAAAVAGAAGAGAHAPRRGREPDGRPDHRAVPVPVPPDRNPSARRRDRLHQVRGPGQRDGRDRPGVDRRRRRNRCPRTVPRWHGRPERCGLVAGRDAPGLLGVRQALPHRRERQRAPAAGHRLCRTLLRHRARVLARRHPARLRTRRHRGHRDDGPRQRSGRGAGLDGRHRNERPRWSPDGKQIVFSRQDKFGNGSAVFVVDADGQNLRQLSSAALPARLPDWSPDGSRIVFTSLVIKYVKVAGTNTQQITQDVYTVRPDWTDLRRLTTDGNSIGATWTPDGRILFATGAEAIAPRRRPMDDGRRRQQRPAPRARRERSGRSPSGHRRRLAADPMTRRTPVCPRSRRRTAARPPTVAPKSGMHEARQ